MFQNVHFELGIEKETFVFEKNNRLLGYHYIS